MVISRDLFGDKLPLSTSHFAFCVDTRDKGLFPVRMVLGDDGPGPGKNIAPLAGFTIEWGEGTLSIIFVKSTGVIIPVAAAAA